MRKRAIHIFKKTRISALILSGMGTGLMLFLLPPVSYFVILLFAVFLSVLGFTASSFFLKKTDALFVGFFLFFFFSLDALLGFNVINSILLLSFVLGLRFLVQ